MNVIRNYSLRNFRTNSTYNIIFNYTKKLPSSASKQSTTDLKVKFLKDANIIRMHLSNALNKSNYSCTLCNRKRSDSTIKQKRLT